MPFKGFNVQKCFRIGTLKNLSSCISNTAFSIENRTCNVNINSAPPCPKDFMVRFITTSPLNFELRNLIRSHIRNQRIRFKKTFFLIGTVPSDDPRKNQLTDEIQKFNDFIFGEPKRHILYDIQLTGNHFFWIEAFR